MPPITGPFLIFRKREKRFDKEGISVPYPQRDVHLYQEKSV